MPHNNQRKHGSHLHKIKRLNHTNQYSEKMTIKNFPRNIIDENFLNKSSKYIKFFDYPLPEILADHSTDPMQNTTRQYIERLSSSSSSNISNEGRFAKHQMIMRKNGETTILRPKQDLVLANGFTPVIRPSSILPSYQSMMSYSQVSSSSLSIMNKMSIIKPEQTSIIKSKRRKRHRRKRCNEKFEEPYKLQDYNFSNNFNHDNSSESTFIHLVKQALHEITEEKNFDNNYLPQQPVPLMSIPSQFHNSSPNFLNNHYNQSHIPPLDDIYFNRNTIQSVCFNEQQSITPLGLISNHNNYVESSYNFPREKYYNFEQNHQLYFDFSKQDKHDDICLHSSMIHNKNYTHMSDYFFD